jgi:hypothetical protein
MQAEFAALRQENMKLKEEAIDLEEKLETAKETIGKLESKNERLMVVSAQYMVDELVEEEDVNFCLVSQVPGYSPALDDFRSGQCCVDLLPRFPRVVRPKDSL